MKKNGEALHIPPSPGGSRRLLGITLVVAVAGAIWLRLGLDRMNGAGLAVGVLVCLWLAYAFSPDGRRRLGLGLWLTAEGFAERDALGASRGHRWDEIASFEVYCDEGRETVAYRLHPAVRPRLHRALGGRNPDGVLALGYATTPQALADLLESWRLRHAGKAGALHALADDAL